jgi:hypothetical protein
LPVKVYSNQQKAQSAKSNRQLLKLFAISARCVLLSRLCEKNEESKAAGLLCKAHALRYEAQKANLTADQHGWTDQKKIGEERRKHLPRINADDTVQKSQEPKAKSSFHQIKCMAAFQSRNLRLEISYCS